MITIDAARALGLEREIGSLEVGKKADVIVLGTDRPHLTPMLMPVHRVVYEATGNDVETVIVDGLVLMENRVPLRVAKSDILAAAEAVSRRTIERAGLAPFIAPPDSFWSNARAQIGDDRADRIPS